MRIFRDLIDEARRYASDDERSAKFQHRCAAAVLSIVVWKTQAKVGPKTTICFPKSVAMLLTAMRNNQSPERCLAPDTDDRYGDNANKPKPGIDQGIQIHSQSLVSIPEVSENKAKKIYYKCDRSNPQRECSSHHIF